MTKKIITSFLIMGLILIPTTFPKAETLKDYKDLLNKYIAEQKANNNKINQTDNQINASEKEIESIKAEIQKNTQEIEQMRNDIVTYNNEIKEKEIETKEIISYYQLSEQENLYLEYAFGAETITDLIYRMSVVEQLVDYNKKTIEELNNKIKANQDREVELNKKEEEMTKRQEELTKKISNLTGVKASLNENSVSVAKQIEIYQEQGCKDNDVIGRDCAVTSSVAGWYRPIQSGYVTSEFGYRWGSLHRAVDVSNKNPYSTKIYPVANGTVVAKYYDSYGALTVVMEHRTANGKYYSSLYTHMSKYAPNIYVGRKLTTADYIGYMGATGLAYGPHLHLEIAPCRLYNQSDRNCSSWNKYVSYVTKIYNNGSFKGPRDLIYFPKPNVFFSGRR